MAFVREDVMARRRIFWAMHFAKMGIEFPAPLRKIHWDAMDTYGSDKPDTRVVWAPRCLWVFSQALSSLALTTTDGQYVKAIDVKGAGTWPRSQVDKLAG